LVLRSEVFERRRDGDHLENRRRHEKTVRVQLIDHLVLTVAQQPHSQIATVRAVDDACGWLSLGLAGQGKSHERRCQNDQREQTQRLHKAGSTHTAPIGMAPATSRTRGRWAPTLEVITLSIG